MRYSILLLVVVALVRQACAQDVEAVIMPMANTPVAGEAATITVLFKNNGVEPAQLHVPDTIRVDLSTEQETVTVTARQLLSSAPVTEMRLGPRSFEELELTLVVPAHISGYVRITLADFGTGAYIARIQPPTGPPLGDTTREPEFATLEEMEDRFQPYFGNLSFYEPAYFLVGTDPEKSRFQISFKYRFFSDDGSLSLRSPWIKGIHFAYTQTSFWNLSSDSAPFEDTSYKPELFYITKRRELPWPGHPVFSLQSGLQHESNGRGGEASRSTNTAFVKPIWLLGNLEKKTGLLIAPRLMAYIRNDDETNRDLPDYRGYFDLQIKFGQLNGLVVDTHIRRGDAGGSFQVDLSFPLSRFIYGNPGLYAYAQYFNGYAESLLFYDKFDSAVRLGVAVAR
jgi:phospholipase A1